MNEVRYVLPNKSLYFLIDRIVIDGDPIITRGILAGIVYSLDPSHFRGVMRAVVKAVSSSGDVQEAGRLSRAIVRGIDFVLDQKRANERRANKIEEISDTLDRIERRIREISKVTTGKKDESDRLGPGTDEAARIRADLEDEKAGSLKEGDPELFQRSRT